MDIYWVKDKQRCGPSTVPDVISLLQVGEISPDTLGWHRGCPGWVPLRELPALADFLNKPAALAEEDENAPEQEPVEVQLPDTPAPAPAEADLPPAGEEKEDAAAPAVTTQRIYLPSPTARLLARIVDYALYAVLYGAFVSLQGLEYNAGLILSVNPLLWLPMLVLEAWLLSTWGTTPGKALLGIRLTTFGEVQRLSFGRALMRSSMAFTLGMGLMVPQLLPIMLLLSYWMLRRRGITPWDARCSTLPTQEAPAQPSRYVLAVVSLYISSVLFFSCMKPWMPGMIDEIGRQNPELAQTLRQLMPQEEAPANQPTPEADEKPAPAAPAAPALQDDELPGT